MVKIDNYGILIRQLNGISFSQPTCLRNTVSSLLKIWLPPYTDLTFTGDFDHSQVKVSGYFLDS